MVRSLQLCKGPTFSLQAETLARTHFPRKNTTTEVTGIFVIRFKPKITANQVDNYIQLHFGVEVKSEKLRTKYDTYRLCRSGQVDYLSTHICVYSQYVQSIELQLFTFTEKRRIYTFNCRSITPSIEEIRNLNQGCDIILLQETWLLDFELSLLSNICQGFYIKAFQVQTPPLGL